MMGKRAYQIAAIMAGEDNLEDRLPVLVNGTDGVRLVGYAATHAEADGAAFRHRICATYNSKARVQMPNGKMSAPFFILHG